MIPFLLLVAIAALWIWGVRCVFSTGHIFEKAGDWIENTFPEWVYKPTIGCQACMSSIHGSLWFWFFGVHVLPLSGLVEIIAAWVVFCFCLCGFNFILLESIYKEE